MNKLALSLALSLIFVSAAQANNCNPDGFGGLRGSSRRGGSASWHGRGGCCVELGSVMVIISVATGSTETIRHTVHTLAVRGSHVGATEAVRLDARAIAAAQTTKTIAVVVHAVAVRRGDAQAGRRLISPTITLATLP